MRQPSAPAAPFLPSAAPPEDRRSGPLRAGLLTVAFTLVLLLAWSQASTLLLIFSGVLLAVFLDGLARGLGKLLPGPRGLHLTLATLALVAGALGLFAYGGATVASQGRELGETVRNQAGTLTQWLASRGIELPPLDLQAGGAGEPKAEGRGEGASQGAGQGAGQGEAKDKPSGGLSSLSGLLKNPGSLLSDAGSVLGPAANVILAIVGALGNVLVIAFLGVAFAADPGSYRNGVLHFVPPRRRERGAHVLDGIGETLRHWLFGQLVTMAVIFVCVWAGLALLGIGGSLVLGLQAGLLAFVPTIGPLIAGLVILLASLSQGLTAVLGALGVYLLVQCLESYGLTPFIQKRALDIPPATIFGGQLLLGGLFGLWGIALALPLMAVMKVLLAQLYVEDTLGEEG